MVDLKNARVVIKGHQEQILDVVFYQVIRTLDELGVKQPDSKNDKLYQALEDYFR